MTVHRKISAKDIKSSIKVPFCHAQVMKQFPSAYYAKSHGRHANSEGQTTMNAHPIKQNVLFHPKVDDSVLSEDLSELNQEA